MAKGRANPKANKSGTFASHGVGEAPRKPEPAAWRYTLRKPAPDYPKGSYVRSGGGLKADNQNG